MKSEMLLLTAGLMLATCAAEVVTEGVVPGEWTMDLDQAVQVASKEKRPMLLNFSGSDWCGWCRLMEEKVFALPEWKTYAAEHIVMVLIDFPQDSSLVPEAYVSRNQRLSEQFGVEGFPTFIVLDDDGTTVLGQLQAGQDKTPASFKAELEKLFRNRPASMAAYLASLDETSKAVFRALMDDLATRKADLEKAETEAMVAQLRAVSLQEEIVELEMKIKEFRVAQLGETKLAEFKELQAQHDIKMKELTDWFETEPEENEENMAKFEAMSQAIMEIIAKLDAF
jgi:thioredoxin-related protein